jgi:hypothetical protein
MREINDKEISKWTNNYIDNLPNGWNTKLDMKIAVKSAMLEALSYPEKYIENNIIEQSEQLKPKQQICYKSNEPCKYDCSGLCKESC